MEPEGKLADKFYLHYLNLMPELGPKRLWKLKDYFGSFKAAAEKARQADLELLRFPPQTCISMLTRCHGLDLEKKVALEAAKISRQDITIISYDESEFPPPLREIATPPLLLYCRGTLPAAEKPCLAMVGSRRPTAYGIKVTEKLVGDLAAAGVVIVSGLAFGIDIAAHKAALKHGGTTIAVVPTGVDALSLYPQAHARVADEIAKSGGVISECPPESLALPYSFLARNRIIAGLCRGTVIVECAPRSGALITARYARDENRSVYAVPGSIFNPMSFGPNALLGQGAIPINSASDILADLNLTGTVIEEKKENLTAEEKLVLQYINSVPASVDDLIKLCAAKLRPAELGAAEVIAALATLELKGFIATDGGQYSLISY